MLTIDQQAGARFLASRTVAMLADVPGYGKTAQAVRGCDYIDARAVNVFAPTQSLTLNWAREFERWSLLGHNVTLVSSEKTELPPAGVVVCTYSMAVRPPIAAQLAKRRVCVTISDEAHGLKDRGSVQSKLVCKAKGVAGVSQRMWFASGSPIPNSADEFYIFAKLSGAWTGNYTDFRDEFCRVIDRGFELKIVGSKNHEKLKAMLAPYYLRRDKVHGLPPLVIDRLDITASTSLDPYAALTPEQRTAVVTAIDCGDWTLPDIPALATVRRAVGLAKAQGVAAQIIRELDAGEPKILCFAYHTPVIDLIAQHIGPRAVIVDGRNSSRRRGIIDAFQNSSEPRVIIGQSRALGEGETLHAASRVILAEPAWTPKDNDQPIARAWRRGQTKPVRASYASLKNSIDAAISASVARKSRDIELVV